MSLIKYKPTSPGTRSVIKVNRSHLHKGGPHGPLTVAQSKTGARNHFGRITTRHVGGGSRQKYRIIDFKRDKDGIAGIVEHIEYDPNRTAHIALILYADGERRYILAPKGVSPGDEIRSGADAPIKPGNAMALRHIPVGSLVHNVELKPGKGGQLASSAGGSVQYTSREGIYASLRLKSTETRRVHVDCRATVGESRARRAQSEELRQGGRQALARHPSHRARPCDESGGSPAWRRRGQVGARQSSSGIALGPECQGFEDAPQQAHGSHDPAAPQEQGTLICRVH